VACDDHDACTGAGRCGGGACLAGPPISCDDSNPCTDDACDSQTGCTHGNNTLDCDDADACTTADRCDAGVCRGGPARDCDDSNPCTDDTCDPLQGCFWSENHATCEDGDLCTVGDTCSSSTCESGTARVCDDGNSCTDDSCNPALGCVTFDNENACDDGLACTVGDVCNGGACIGSALVPADIAATLRLSKSSGVAVLGWSAAADAASYAVLRGRTSELPVGPGAGDATETCFASSLLATTVTDATAHPASGTAFWYVVRGENACSDGTWGYRGNRGVAGAERVSFACP